jgi:signal transduction histidine kinase
MAGQLLAARSGLEEQVRQRTGDLSEAHERLQTLYRSRVQLLADVSHELRTPLTVLRGEAEVALRGETLPADVSRDALRRILDKASEMSRLVDDILFLARTETDTIRFERGRADLLEIAAEAIREAAVLGRHCDIEIAATLPQTPLSVEGDRHRLKQVLIIVLDNAIKYSDEGMPVLFDLSLDDRQQHAVMTISNKSSTISPEDLPFLFDRFYRGRHQKYSLARGSGLGLPIARFIVEKHGGSIRLEGDAQQRISVSIRLPAARGAEPPAQRPPAWRYAGDGERSSKLPSGTQAAGEFGA